MNWLDILFAVILLFCAIKSFRRGFVREVVGFAATLLGLLCGMWFHGIAAAYIEPYVGNVRIAKLLGFLLVFLGIVFLGVLFGWSISRFVRSIGLSFVDRFMGATVGLARGVLLSVGLLIAVTAFAARGPSAATPRAVLHSQLAPWLLKASDYGVSLAPLELKQAFRKYYGEIKNTLKQTKSDTKF